MAMVLPWAWRDGKLFRRLFSLAGIATPTLPERYLMLTTVARYGWDMLLDQIKFRVSQNPNPELKIPRQLHAWYSTTKDGKTTYASTRLDVSDDDDELCSKAKAQALDELFMILDDASSVVLTALGVVTAKQRGWVGK